MIMDKMLCLECSVYGGVAFIANKDLDKFCCSLVGGVARTEPLYRGCCPPLTLSGPLFDVQGFPSIYSRTALDALFVFTQYTQH